MNAKTNNGFTPLMQAILTGHTECAETLVAAGANVNNTVTLKPCSDDIMKKKEAAMTTVSLYLAATDIITKL